MIVRAPPNAIAIRRRKRWGEFMDFAIRHGSSQWLFRGVADAVSHLLIPKIGRDPKRYNAGAERILFQNFRRRAPQFRDVVGLSSWDMLALAQHHGLPTRLLDWTTNPLVAAFFAVSSEPVTTEARVYAYRATTIIDPDKDTDPFLTPKVAVHIPTSVAARIVSQRGVFTVHPSPTVGLTSTGLADALRRFDIAAEDRPYFERRLFGLAIDPSVIRMDLDGLCQALTWQFDRGVALGKMVF